MNLLRCKKSQIIKDENGENVPKLETAEVILVHCNIVNNYYQQDSRVLWKLVSNKSFGHLLDILTKSLIFSKTVNSKVSFIKV